MRGTFGGMHGTAETPLNGKLDNHFLMTSTFFHFTQYLEEIGIVMFFF